MRIYWRYPSIYFLFFGLNALKGPSHEMIDFFLLLHHTAFSIFFFFFLFKQLFEFEIDSPVSKTIGSPDSLMLRTLGSCYSLVYIAHYRKSSQSSWCPGHRRNLTSWSPEHQAVTTPWVSGHREVLALLPGVPDPGELRLLGFWDTVQILSNFC